MTVKSNEGFCRDTRSASVRSGHRSRVQVVLRGRRLHTDIPEGGDRGPKGHQGGNPGLAAKSGQKASAEFSSRGMAALQSVMISQVHSELDRLRDCLAKVK